MYPSFYQDYNSESNSNDRDQGKLLTADEKIQELQMLLEERQLENEEMKVKLDEPSENNENHFDNLMLQAISELG